MDAKEAEDAARGVGDATASVTTGVASSSENEPNRVTEEHFDGTLQDETVESVKDSEGCQVTDITVEAEAMNEGTPTDDAARSTGVAVQIKRPRDVAASTGDGSIVKELEEPPAKAPSGRRTTLMTKSHAPPERRPVDRLPTQNQRGPPDGRESAMLRACLLP